MITLLLENEADPHAVTAFGTGAIHYLSARNLANADKVWLFAPLWLCFVGFDDIINITFPPHTHPLSKNCTISWKN